MKILSKADAILVPVEDSAQRVVEGRSPRQNMPGRNKIPYFGLCLGMQVAVIEFARNVLGLSGAKQPLEMTEMTPHPVIHYMEGQKTSQT
jgi:CTP synthase